MNTQENAQDRRTRRFFSGLGVFFILVAAYAFLRPDGSSKQAFLISGGIGLSFLVIGSFGSKRIVKWVSGVLEILNIFH
jgi:hypothetical protein